MIVHVIDNYDFFNLIRKDKSSFCNKKFVMLNFLLLKFSRNFFQLGWALKENQEYGKKGGGKHMSYKVIELLKTFFHSGDINKSERYTAKEMFEELQNNVETGELEVNDIPKLKTIENWISRYSSQHKKAMAKRQRNNE